jgi:hypothetical protein
VIRALFILARGSCLMTATDIETWRIIEIPLTGRPRAGRA